MTSLLPEHLTLQRLQYVLSLFPALSEQEKNDHLLNALANLYKDLDPTVYQLTQSLFSFPPPSNSFWDVQENPGQKSIPWYELPVDKRRVNLSEEYPPQEIEQIKKHLGLTTEEVSLEDLTKLGNALPGASSAWVSELKWCFFSDKRNYSPEEIERLDSYFDNQKSQRRAAKK